MTDKKVSRRRFLESIGVSAGGVWATARWPALMALGSAACTARDKGIAFVSFDNRLAQDLIAMAEQIIPGGDSPGAKDIGVIHFIDLALQDAFSGSSEFLLQALSEFNQGLSDEKGVGHFSQLSLEEQQTALASIEGQPLFEFTRFLTVAGVFAMPKYGGNKDYLGWDMLGFEHQHAWQPPFGHYDRKDHA